MTIEINVTGLRYGHRIKVKHDGIGYRYAIIKDFSVVNTGYLELTLEDMLTSLGEQIRKYERKEQ